MSSLPPPGSPLAPRFWKDETSGVLAAAIRSYLDNPEAMTMREVAFVRVYLRQWVASPVWQGDEVDKLRASVDSIASARGISDWLRAAEEMGIDPL